MHPVFIFIMSLIAVFLSFILLTKGYQRIIKKVRKMKRLKRRDALFNVNQRPSRMTPIFKRLLFLSKQNRSSFEDQVKFVYGEVFELDNSHPTVDTKTILSMNIDRLATAYQLATARILLRWRKSAAFGLIHYTKSTVTFSKLIRCKIHKIITKYIHNSGGQINEETDRG